MMMVIVGASAITFVKDIPPKHEVLKDKVSGRAAYQGPQTTARARTIEVVVALICMFFLAFMMGFRANRFQSNKPIFAQALVFIQTFLALCFVLSSSIVVSGLGLTTDAQCYGAIIICLFFYTSTKMLLYIFLLERAHIVRAPFMQRRIQDWLWISGMTFIVLAFGGLSIWCYITPHADIDAEDGRCRIGTSAITSYLLLAFDASIIAALTIIFIILLHPVIRFRKINSDSISSQATIEVPSQTSSWVRKSVAKIEWLGMKVEDTRNRRSWIDIKAVLRKNVIGSMLIFLASAANLTAFYVNKSRQLGFICLVACMADVTFGVIVVHWLTIGSSTATGSRSISHPPASQTLSLSSTSTSISAAAVVEPTPALKGSSSAG